MLGRAHAGVLAAAPLFALVVACSAAPAGESIGVDVGAIVGGAPDTTHKAVVAIISSRGEEATRCSGTIIKTDPEQKIGWVATAAHCVSELPPILVLGADDFADPLARRFQIIDFAFDRRYANAAGSPYDFAIIRIAGVDATTPTIPLVRGDDTLVEGATVTSVGYGRTTGLAPAPGAGSDSTIRKSIAKKIASVDARLIKFDMSTDGFCFGDSGGPVLAQSGETKRVVGIHSYVARDSDTPGSCIGDGFSGRVTAAGTFFTEAMAKPLPEDACLLCKTQAASGDGQCAVARRACLGDPDCKSYYQCRVVDKEPESTCKTKFPAGEAPALAALGCVCETACVAECGETATCDPTLAPPPSGNDGDEEEGGTCSVNLAPGDCNTCVETACCAEVKACADDPTCQACTLAAPPAAVGSTRTDNAACTDNALRAKLGTCAATHCANECAAIAPPSSSDGEEWSPDSDIGVSGNSPSAEEEPEGSRIEVRKGALGACSFGTLGTGAGDTTAVAALALAATVACRRRRARIAP